jgi:hypothetical protein
VNTAHSVRSRVCGERYSICPPQGLPRQWQRRPGSKATDELLADQAMMPCEDPCGDPCEDPCGDLAPVFIDNLQPNRGTSGDFARNLQQNEQLSRQFLGEAHHVQLPLRPQGDWASYSNETSSDLHESADVPESPCLEEEMNRQTGRNPLYPLDLSAEEDLLRTRRVIRNSRGSNGNFIRTLSAGNTATDARTMRTLFAGFDNASDTKVNAPWQLDTLPASQDDSFVHCVPETEEQGTNWLQLAALDQHESCKPRHAANITDLDKFALKSKSSLAT